MFFMFAQLLYIQLFFTYKTHQKTIIILLSSSVFLVSPLLEVSRPLLKYNFAIPVPSLSSSGSTKYVLNLR